MEQGIIMWGYRAVIPTTVREQLLDELHNNHEGMSNVKSNAHSYFWWPSLDSDIEEKVNNCNISVHPDPPKARLIGKNFKLLL